MYPNVLQLPHRGKRVHRGSAKAFVHVDVRKLLPRISFYFTHAVCSFPLIRLCVPCSQPACREKSILSCENQLNLSVPAIVQKPLQSGRPAFILLFD